MNTQTPQDGWRTDSLTITLIGMTYHFTVEDYQPEGMTTADRTHYAWLISPSGARHFVSYEPQRWPWTDSLYEAVVQSGDWSNELQRWLTEPVILQAWSRSGLLREILRWEGRA